MSELELRIVHGPDKPALQRAVAYPERHLHVHFDTEKDAIDAHIDKMQELADGTQFGLTGHITSGSYKGWSFNAVYDLTSRTGVIKALDPDPAPPSRA